LYLLRSSTYLPTRPESQFDHQPVDHQHAPRVRASTLRASGNEAGYGCSVAPYGIAYRSALCTIRIRRATRLLHVSDQTPRESEFRPCLHRSGEASPLCAGIHGGRASASVKAFNGDAPVNGLVVRKGSKPCVQPPRDNLVMLAPQANCRHA
jgi:hypothetical protein